MLQHSKRPKVVKNSLSLSFMPTALAPSKASATNARSVEQTYQKLSQHEHILTRPDTYVGSVEHHSADMSVFDKPTNRMLLKKISYVPGLYKIYDEILVNAADNKQRDAAMSEIRYSPYRPPPFRYRSI